MALRISPRSPRGGYLLGAVAAVGLLAAPLFSAEPFKFAVPVVVNGQTYQGEGVLDADGSIRVTVVLVYRMQPGPVPPPVFEMLSSVGIQMPLASMACETISLPVPSAFVYAFPLMYWVSPASNQTLTWL